MNDVENDLKTLNILKIGRELLRIVGIGGSELWRQPRPVTGCYAYKEGYKGLSEVRSFMLCTTMHIIISKALESNKMTLFAKDLLTSEDFLMYSFSTPPP
ncbi:hypothetical protein TNCV_4657541 [Trichonephila clavipes]|nr:hypothetical protein TNCV_4657541 [Trichonephila clavipes]